MLRSSLTEVDAQAKQFQTDLRREIHPGVQKQANNIRAAGQATGQEVIQLVVLAAAMTCSALAECSHFSHGLVACF